MSELKTVPFELVAVVGVGYMGYQIGLHTALHGYPVIMIGRSEESLERAKQMCIVELDKRIKSASITDDQKTAVLNRMHFTTDMDEVAKADLVIETIKESLEEKRELFKKLDSICKPDAILASNSSSLRISLIEDVTDRLERVLNLHFYTPVWTNAMVELARGSKTSDTAINQVKQFAESIALLPLIVQKESTGFIFNRIWRAIKRETLHLVNDGVASVEDVDRAWMIMTGTSIGPFGMMDMVGLDVVRDIEMVYYRESGDTKDAPPTMLLNKIDRGELGIKAGKGFYSYPNPAYRDPDFLKQIVD